MNDLLSARETARELGVSHTTISRWVKAGKLRPSAKSSFGPLFDREQVTRFAQKRDQIRELEASSVA